MNTKIFLCVLACLALVYLSFISGSQEMSLFKIFNSENIDSIIFWEIRFPRTLAAGIAGAMLGLCGLQLQTLFKNPLASPSILGLHSGASFTIALSSFTGISFFTFDLGRIGSAFLGAFIFSLLLLALAKKGYSGTVILLTGVLLSYLTSAIVSVLIYRGDPSKVKEFLMWGMGGFDAIQLVNLPWLIIFCIASFLLFLLSLKGLDSLLLGNAYSSSLGFNPDKLKFLVLSSSCLSIAAIISYCGPIGFIGLIAPPLARKISKRHLHKNLFLIVMLIGFSLCLMADLIVRWFGPLPINAILGLLGAPLILSQLFKLKGGLYEN